MKDEEILTMAKGRIHLGIKHIKKTITSMQSTARQLIRLKLVTETSGYDNMIEGLGVAVEFLSSNQGLANTVLIILCQTRDNLGQGWSTKTRSGGRALKFYATAEIWSSIIKTLTKTVKEAKRKIGVRTKLEIKKNRITGKLKFAEVDIFPSYGMDDIGSCVDYLIAEKWWKKTKKGIRCPEIRIQGTREKIIRGIEARGLEEKLKETCEKCWKEIEDACSLKRKSKYMGAS